MDMYGRQSVGMCFRRQIRYWKKAGGVEGTGWQKGAFAHVAELVSLSWINKNIGPKNPPIRERMKPEYMPNLIRDIQKNGVQYPAFILAGVGNGLVTMGEGNHRIVAANRMKMKTFPVFVWIWDKLIINKQQEKWFPGRNYSVRRDLVFGFSEDLPHMMKPSEVFKSLASHPGKITQTT